MKKAAAVVILNDDRVLGVSRKNDPTDMGLPGGKLELGETYEEGAIRETLEETGLQVEIITQLFMRIDGDTICRTFLAKQVDSTAQIATTEAGRVDWITWEELFRGTFGEYNRSLYDFIKDKIKLS